MEQNQNPMIFTIISGDDVLIKEVLENYNNTYNTDFEIVNFMFDEVVFAEIKVSNYSISDIFNLGFQFGSFVQIKRGAEEIDW